MEQAFEMIKAEHKIFEEPSEAELMGGRVLSTTVASVNWTAMRDVVSQTDWEWSYAFVALDSPVDLSNGATNDESNGADPEYTGDDWDTVPRPGDGTPWSQASFQTA